MAGRASQKNHHAEEILNLSINGVMSQTKIPTVNLLMPQSKTGVNITYNSKNIPPTFFVDGDRVAKPGCIILI
jgi:hypothetical protein